MKHTKYLLLAVLLLGACTNGDKKEEKKEDQIAKLKKERSDLDNKLKKLEAGKTDSTKRTPVTVMTVQRSKFTDFIDLQSQITSDDNVNALPQTTTASIVNTVLVHVGQHVTKGQVMATLDASSLDQQLASQDVQLNLAKTIYDKQQKLWAQEIGTEVQLLQAKANYEVAMKQRQNLNAQRNTYRIVAPITGTVDVVNLKTGDVVSANSGTNPLLPGIRIVNGDKLKAEANLGESYIGKVAIGAPVTLVFPDINDSIQTNVTYVAQAVDPASRTFNVQVRLGSNSKLHPNMSCRMKIASYQDANALVVPASVIQKTAEGDALYINAGGKAKSVKVTVGRISNGKAQILSGLNGGEQVITEGYQDLDDGQVVVPAP